MFDTLHLTHLSFHFCKYIIFNYEIQFSNHTFIVVWKKPDDNAASREFFWHFARLSLSLHPK